MNRVICDVCGTKYPESAEQCPICGCAKPENARIISGEPVGENEATGHYTHVKGGRFSKSNVRKRNKAAASARETKADIDTDDIPKEKDHNKGLVIAVVALLLAIVAVMLFVFFKYFMPAGNVEGTKDTGSAVETTTESTTAEPTDTTVLDYPCTGIALSVTNIRFDELGDSWLLSAELSPLNTTDVLSFNSGNDAIVAVTNEGLVTAVAAGETVITVTCGDITETCTVYVTDSSATTETTTAPDNTDSVSWSLNRDDITFKKQGESWPLYKGDVDKEDITWTSDDPTIATFENGIVTAVAPGTTKVHAEYNGTKYTCTIRCSFEVSAGEEATDPSETTEATEPSGSQTEYTLYINGVSVEDLPWGAEVTIKVKESFKLTLRTNNNDIIAVTWSASKENICSIDGNTITGKAKGTTEIVVNYAGEIYSCTVHVENK